MSRSQSVTLDEAPHLSSRDWIHARAGRSSAWAVVTPLSERNELHFQAQGDRTTTTWTLSIYRRSGGSYITQIAHGVGQGASRRP